MSIAQRIQLVINYYNMSYNSFGKSLGMGNGTAIKTMIDNYRNPQNKTLNRISSAYPDINMNWLRTGTGQMIKGLSNPFPMSTFSQRIKEILFKEGLTIKAFCKKIGLNSTTTIAKIVSENRKPSPKTIKRILDGFPNMDADWFIYGKNKNNLPESMSDNDDLTVTAKQVIKQLDINKLHYTALLEKKFMEKKADNRTLAELSNKQLTYIERLSLETFNLEKSLWKIVKSSDDIDIKNKIITQIEKLSEINGSFIQVIMRNRE
tara:strand:- start:3090 stop:3878 length:789 start_codon:yes stop_codon:yes gene_type:complete